MDPPDITESWLVRLLGGVAVQHGATTHRRFRTRKAQELLAWLAWHVGQPQERDELVALLWPEAASSAGRNRLSFTLSTLRNLLTDGDDCPLGADQHSVWLDERTCAVDARRFELAASRASALTGEARLAALREAVGWYGGSFASGLDADWTAVPAAALGVRWHDLVAELMTALRDANRPSEAEAALHEAQRIDPASAPTGSRPLAAVSSSSGLITYVATIRCWPSPPGARAVPQPDQDVCVTAFGSPSAAMNFVSAVVAAAPSARVGIDLAEPREEGEADASALARRLCRSAHAGQMLCTAGPAALLRRAELATALRLGQFVPEVGAAEETIYQLGLPGTPQTSYPVPRLLEARPLGQPSWLTRFVGRGVELQRLQELLLEERVRLVTLTGPAGIGKTRLAAAIAALVSDSFGGAVWFASLGGCEDPARLPSMLRDSLQTGPQVDADPFETVCEALGGERSLLVMDGVDPAVRGAERWLFRLLTRAPRVTCLVTTQRPLSLDGETIVRLGPLWPPSEDATPEEVFSNEAARLLLDRIERSGSREPLGPAQAEPIARICRLLEGVPMALELAAASICADGLASTLASLEATAARRSTRAQGVPTALTAAWRRLSVSERHFIERLAAMPAPFTAEQAAGILSRPDAEELVERLRQTGLVRLANDPRGVRFVLPQAVRTFANARRPPAETADLALRHARWFAEAKGGSSESSPADAEHFAVAVETLLPQQPGEALAAVLSNLPAIEATGRSELGRTWLRRALNATADHPLPLRACGLAELGRLSFWVDLFDGATTAGDAVTLWRQLGDVHQEALALTHLVRCLVVVGADAALGEAVSRLERLRQTAGRDTALAVQATVALFIAAQIQPKDLPGLRRDLQRCLAWFEAQHNIIEAALHQQRLATMAVFESNLDDAEYWLDQSDTALAAHGSADCVRSQWIRAVIALRRSDLPRALAASRTAMRMAIRLGGRWPLIHGLSLFAGTLCQMGHAEPAARLLGQARARQQRERLDSYATSPRFFVPDLEATLQARLGLAAYERLLSAGATDSLEALLDQIDVGLHLDTELR